MLKDVRVQKGVDMGSFTSQIRVPGVVWAVVLIITIALIHENEAWIQANWGLDPFILDIVVGMLIAVLKSLSLGTEELNQALDILESILARRGVPPPEGMRGAGDRSIYLDDEIALQPIPPRPNPLIRWFLG